MNQQDEQDDKSREQPDRPPRPKRPTRRGPVRCPHCQALVEPAEILPGPVALCPRCRLPLKRDDYA